MTADTVKKTHPIRGFFWGLVFGIGLALVLVITTVISLSLVNLIIVVVAGLVLGVAWGLFGPAKAPKGEPPSSAVPPPPTSRFDDRPAGEMPDPVAAPGNDHVPPADDAATSADGDAAPPAEDAEPETDSGSDDRPV